MRPSANRHVLSVLRKILGRGVPLEQHRLATKVGCATETIRKIEKGKLKLSVALAERIYLTTGVSPTWLLANDMHAPPLNGTTGAPYTREVYEAIQANLAVSEGRESFSDRHNLIRSVETLLGSFLAAEKRSMQAAALVRYRFQCLAEELKEEFGWDGFSYSKEGQKPWDKVHKSIYGFFEKANFKPVPMADGTMREIVFSDQIQS